MFADSLLNHSWADRSRRGWTTADFVCVRGRHHQRLASASTSVHARPSAIAINVRAGRARSPAATRSNGRTKRSHEHQQRVIGWPRDRAADCAEPNPEH